MKYIKFIFILLVVWPFLCQYSAKADNRIVVYLRKAPPEIISQVIDAAKNDILAPEVNDVKNFEFDALKNKYRKLLTPKLSGFTAIYGGYIDISDKDGLLQFPLRQELKKIYIAFTEKIKLVKVKDNTFSHREFANPEKYPVNLYVYEKKIDPQNNNYWSVQKTELPKDNRISPLTIVIFTNPSNVCIKTGDFLNNDSQHFVLPEIFVIDTQNQALTDLNILKVRRFFEPVKFDKKPATEKSEQEFLTNN